MNIFFGNRNQLKSSNTEIINYKELIEPLKIEKFQLQRGIIHIEQEIETLKKNLIEKKSLKYNCSSQ